MVGVSLTQDQVKRLSEQEVEKYFKRCEALLSSKTCDAMVDTSLQLLRKALVHLLPVDAGKLLKGLKDNFMEVWKLHGNRRCCSSQCQKR